MRYYEKMSGSAVYLSPISTEDADTYARWLNDKAVSEYMGLYAGVISLAAEQKTVEDMAVNGQNYAIVLRDNDRLIGNISLMDIEPASGRAAVGLFIGDAENRGKGYGAQALRLILDFGFNTLNLHNIMLHVYADNEPGIACYKKVGFREFGRRREAKFKNGRYVDIVHMDILASEFRAGHDSLK